MSEDSIPKYLISLIPQFTASLELSYNNHNTLLKFQDAAKTAIKVLHDKTGNSYKIDASDIRRFVKYLDRKSVV